MLLMKKAWVGPVILVFMALAIFIVPLQGQKELDKNAVLKRAMEFANMKAVSSISQPRVNYSHSQFYQVMGNDENGRVLVALDAAGGEVVRVVRLCPYPGLFVEKSTIDLKRVEQLCREHLKSWRLPEIPKSYALEAIREKNILDFKQYEVTFRHRHDDIPVMTDFVSFLLGGTGELVSYSKVHHEVDVATTPKIDRKEAVKQARGILGKGNLKEYSPKWKALDASLKIVYPNYYFEKWHWEWSERQALVWVVKFGEKGKPAIDIWIDAHTGKNQGGEIYERPIPDLFGIPNQTGDITGIWQPALNKMQYNTGTARTILADTTEATVVNAISNGFIFILQTHGGTTATAESATIGHGGTFDANTLEPDEIPANNLYYALMSCCESGHDGSGLDFKDTFLSQGALCFQGYSPSINPDPYEEALVRYLAEGENLYNAHNLAVADTSPWFDIIINWQAWCLNSIYLAPLRVSTSAPAHAGCRFTISASIYNGEAALATTANEVKAFLKLPLGFTLASGSGPLVQSNPSISYGHSWTATWKVKAPFWTFGNRTFDIVVWSDNLGVAVHDFDDPYHKFSVHVSCPFFIPLHEMVIAEIFRWWEWAADLYPESSIPKTILKYQSIFLDKYRSDYFFQKDTVGFLKALLEIVKAEYQFGRDFPDKAAMDQKALDDYITAVGKMDQFLAKAAEKKISDVIRFYKEVGMLQADINEKATVVFGPPLPQK